MTSFRWIVIAAMALLGSGVSTHPARAADQTQNTRKFVQGIVDHELKADANDHSRWMYLDSKTTAGKTTVTIVVDTNHGSLSKTIKIDGRPLTAEQRQVDERRMHSFVTDPSVRQKQKEDDKHDEKQVIALTKMLPDGFLWTKTKESGDETTLAFRPNPRFNPPSREARVFAAMKGTMVVNTKDKRIQSLQGTLINDVTFGWFGVFGRLQKGGSFQIERRPIGDGVWAIIKTEVHIHGHALLFKTISTDEDEEKSHFQPTPESVTLAEAEKMLNSGEVARQLGITPEH